MGVASAFQVAATVVAFFGDQIFAALGVGPARWIDNLMENRLQLLLVGFVFSSYAQNLSATGAFEIFVNGELVFSKLQTGRLPTVEEIHAVVGRALASTASGLRDTPSMKML